MPFMRDRLKKRRLDLGLTLEQVANEMNVERPTIQRYESGKIKSISAATVESLAQVLQCSPSYLMGWSESIQNLDRGSTIRPVLAKSLKRFRELAGFTVRDVGTLVGKSCQTVSAWENCRGQPDADMLLKLCEIYHLDSVASFFEQIPVSLPKDEQTLLELYRNATNSGKKGAFVILEAFQK